MGSKPSLYRFCLAFGQILARRCKQPTDPLNPHDAEMPRNVTLVADPSTVVDGERTRIVCPCMAAPKGHPRYGGRTKGTPNRESKALRELILGALDELGGQDYLVEQGRTNPGTFLMLIGKVLPTTLAGDPNAPLVLVPLTEEQQQEQARQRREQAVAAIRAAFAERPLVIEHEPRVIAGRDVAKDVAQANGEASDEREG